MFSKIQQHQYILTKLKYLKVNKEKNTEQGTLLNLFYEASVTVIPKLDKDIKRMKLQMCWLKN